MVCILEVSDQEVIRSEEQEEDRGVGSRAAGVCVCGRVDGARASLVSCTNSPVPTHAYEGRDLPAYLTWVLARSN